MFPNIDLTSDEALDASCIYCGDACGTSICYSCEETAEAMGLEL